MLPDDIVEDMAEILDYARHQQTVFEQWGFGSKINYGRGLSVLFSGPPGTGKTLMAGIIARELGRELFRIDLSRVVDKFIGETEKNLSRVFDEAERAQTVLLFDEADSLFAKRTAVSSSNDRYANLEVNYLLQRASRASLWRRSARRRFAPEKSASRRSAPTRELSIRRAPRRSASRRSTSPRSMAIRSSPERSAPTRSRLRSFLLPAAMSAITSARFDMLPILR